MLRLAGFGLLLLLTLASGEASQKTGASLEKRIPCNTSRVTGWPEPPPPYRTRRVFEKHAFRAPVYLIAHKQHDLLFVVEQSGRIVHFSPSGSGAPQPFLELKDVDTYAMTFHPAYATNGLVYVFANGPNSVTKKRNQILRYKVIPGAAPRCDPASRQLIIEWESNGHNGGDLGFGPDGFLYITSGDGSSDSDTDNTGQDLRDLCSGVLRIDVDRPAAGMAYGVPADNPFLSIKEARPELWAFGFRNPWRMTFDPRSGDLLVGDVGQDLWEMIRLVRRGSNHGWSVTEGSKPFHENRTRGPGPIVPPLIEHPHSESRSITGGIVYQGKKHPGLRDAYIYGDYSTGKIWGLRQEKGKVTWKAEVANTRLQIVGFGADRDGELYIVDVGGQIHQLEQAPPPKPSSFPRTLSESGLYLSVKDHRYQPGVIPYSVNAQLWSDGSWKERAMAIPGMEQVNFSESGFWQFPAGTVLIKTFSLTMADGVRRRIETRFMTLQEGEWYGYSYRWNPEGTDAQLVEAGGDTRTYSIRDEDKPDAVKELAWRFPSRTECMVCHSRAANYVLGISTHQLNREHDYGGIRRNQLKALEQLGIFRVPRLRHWEALEESAGDLVRLGEWLNSSHSLEPLTRQWTAPAIRSLRAQVVQRSNQVRAKLDKAPPSTRLPRAVEQLPRLADPTDKRAEVNARMRSYFHANCAHCHVWAGGGNSAIDLHISTSLDKMKLVGEKPLHDRFGIEDARLVTPGVPERSIVYQRISRRGKGQMPPLATTQVDRQAVQLLREWILQQKQAR
ncbi:MAG: PQQ-dependent sugar dehydrogenase [Gemmataceae bacterium]